MNGFPAVTTRMGYLFTPHSRGKVTRTLAKKRRMSITRGGLRCKFEILEQPTLGSERIKWSVRNQHNALLADGIAGTVFEATESIEKEIGELGRWLLKSLS